MHSWTTGEKSPTLYFLNRVDKNMRGVKMRKIKIKKWTEKDRQGNDVEADTLTLLNSLVSLMKPEEIPRGYDQFRLFGRIGKAFDKAEKTGFLEVEELEYSFLKKTIESQVIGPWAMNPDILEAVELFMDAEEVK